MKYLILRVFWFKKILLWNTRNQGHLNFCCCSEVTLGTPFLKFCALPIYDPLVQGSATPNVQSSVSEALPEVEAVDFGWKRKRLSLVGSGCRKRLKFFPRKSGDTFVIRKMILISTRNWNFRPLFDLHFRPPIHFYVRTSPNFDVLRLDSLIIWVGPRKRPETLFRNFCTDIGSIISLS